MNFYHLVNRGVEKRKVFMEDGDLVRFIHDLYVFNDAHASPNFVLKARHVERPRALLVYIHAFALMPNHYHLLVSPAVENGIPLFIKKLQMGYAKYFNEKYSRTGSLWQGKYRKIEIARDAHFMFVPFYIHLNPLDLSLPVWREGSIKNPRQALDLLAKYRWSSHRDYLGEKNFPSVIHTDVVAELLGSRKNYEQTIAEIISTSSLAVRSNAFEI